MTDSVNLPIGVTAGVVYLLMALTVWRLLRGAPQARVVRLWAIGALLASAVLVLLSARALVPLPLALGLTTVLAVGAMVLQAGALRLHLGRVPLWRPLLLPLLPAAVLLVAMLALGHRQWLFVSACLLIALYTGALAWHAGLTARQEQSAGARLLAWSQWALVVGLMVRAAGVAAGVAPYQPGRGGITYWVVNATAVLAALYGSLGFMSLMLDITRRAERRSRDAEVAAAAGRAAAERTADELRALLAQRDALAQEREGLLQLLAHEIRQPLHNASGALRAAGQMLKSPQPLALDQVAQGLSRAEKVLVPVRSVLDNTLAVATVLARKAPLAMQQVDLSFLVELAMGDLDEAQRGRLEVAWHTDLRELDMEPGLLRLALRNLLVNAFHHGGPRVQVVLDIDEEPDASAVVLKVQDNGPGMAPAALATALGIGEKAAGRASLGLLVVRQVAALHGGSLTLANRPGGGLQAWLRLPLPGVQ